MTKNRKKIIAKVLASGMLLSNIPIQIFAEEIETIILDETNNNYTLNEELINIDEGEVELDNNTKDLTSENTNNNLEILEYNIQSEQIAVSALDNQKELPTTKTEDNKYIINSVDDLKQLRTEININNLDTTDMIIELGSDIDFTGETNWEAIGTNKNMFKGTFDGKNHTIKNINISGEFEGLFNNTNGSIFQNINFDNININSTSVGNIGILVGLSNNSIKIDNLNFSNINFIANNASILGGIVGAVPTKISNFTNISFDGNISSTKGNVASILGYGSGNFSKINIKGQIIGANYVGGLIYMTSGSPDLISTIEDIDVNAYIKSLNGGNVGGVVAQSTGYITFNNINVEGQYIGSESMNSTVGGIIGSMVSYSNQQNQFITNSIVNTIKIEGGDVGGIIGLLASTKELVVENNKIYSNINGFNQVGGIGGSTTSSIVAKNNIIENNYIKSLQYASGLFGRMNNGKSLVENNNIESNISSTNKASGMASEVWSTDTNFINNTFKGKVESLSNTGYASGLSCYWKSSNAIISGNKIEAEIISLGNESSGLIGEFTMSDCIVENNTINAIISGKDIVGGLIAKAEYYYNIVRNNKINVIINANDKVGGLGGILNTLSIENNDVTSIINANDKVGGIVGETSHPDSNYLNNTINTNITSNNTVGGLGGYILGGIIENNKIISEINANDKIGGITGEVYYKDSLYSKNTVKTNILGNDKVGGIFGYGNPVNINNNFIYGTVSGTSNVGSLMGNISGSGAYISKVENCIVAVSTNAKYLINTELDNTDKIFDIQNIYYDTNLTELTDIYGIGLMTLQMQGKEALKNMNLDFENIWKSNKEFYPTFEQINSAPDIIPNDNVIDSIITINQYDKFNPLDYVIVEDFEGNEFTVSIKDIEDTFDTSKFGEFPITYVATDDKGLSSELTLTLKINPLQVVINNIPTIIAEDKILTVGDKFNPLSMIVAYDKEDGIITDNIKIVKNTVNLKKAGVYKITYEIEDKEGAKATKTIQVTVKDKAISNNNQNNSNTTDKDKNDDSTEKTDKPQTSDIGLWGTLGIILSVIGLYFINRKKK